MQARLLGGLAALVAVLVVGLSDQSPLSADAGSTGCAFERVRTREVYLDQAGAALVDAAAGIVPPAHPALAPEPLEVGPAGVTTVAPYFPPSLVRAISYIESAWSMANFQTARGRVGPVLTSSSCAYGIMQVLSGMQPANRRRTPTALQRLILTNYVANVQGGLGLLAAKWNLGGADTWPWVGDRDPAVLENWYYAAWAYYAMFPSLTPVNPDYPWPRPTYNSPACRNQPRGCSYSDYPYQELVLGLVENPPILGVAPDGSPVRLWEPRPVQLPARKLFYTRRKPRTALWPPPVLPAFAIETRDDTESPAPVLALETEELTLNYAEGDRAVVDRPVTTILNNGTGIIAPNITAAFRGPSRKWLTSWTVESTLTPARLLVTFDPSTMAAGEYTASFTISSAVAEGSPKVFTLKVCVGTCGIVH